MSSNIDFKDLWQKQTSPSTPTPAEIIAKAVEVKQKIRRKLVLGIVVLLVTIAGILFVWFNSNLRMLTTKWGITIIIVAIMLAIVNASQIVFSIKQNPLHTNNNQYLAQMIRLKKQQEFAQTKLLSVYYILLSTGLALYTYEPASRMSTAGMLAAYAVTFAWIAFSWFYLRPRSMKKQQAKLNHTIQTLQNINRNSQD